MVAVIVFLILYLTRFSASNEDHSKNIYVVNETTNIVHATNFKRSLHWNLKKFKILCFGDSLTKGYYLALNKYNPYSNMLSNLLTKHLGNQFEVVTDGTGGATVHKQMKERLMHLMNLHDFDLVLILGGVNDLVNLDCLHDVDLNQEIKSLHFLAHRHGGENCCYDNIRGFC